MNTIDIEILKILFVQPNISIYQLNKTLNKLGRGDTNYTTLRRHVIEKLSKDGLLKITPGRKSSGKIDNRKTRNLSWTEKGIAFLAVNADLNDGESRKLVHLWLSNSQKEFGDAVGFVGGIASEIFQDVFKRLRPRINLEHFDEVYARDLLLENLISVIMGHSHRIIKETRNLPRGRVREDVKRLALQKDIRTENIRVLSFFCEYLGKKRDYWNRRLSQAESFLRLSKESIHRSK